jgi:HEPN domain-containing protein
MRSEPEMRVTETAMWLVKTAHDLRAASAVLRLRPPVTDAAMFHCQQAVEKTLKAFLVWHRRPVPKIHDLRILGNQCSEVDPTLAQLILQVEHLSVHAVLTRYPGDAREPRATVARTALTATRKAIRQILDRLPKAVRPRGIRL